MKAPKDFDPDVHTVLELVQHCGEILARLPLSPLRAYLEANSPGPEDPHGVWFSKAMNACLAAQQLDAAVGILSAEEARVVLPPAPVEAIRPDLPDDWAHSK